MEKTVKHFCTTTNRIKKGVVEFVKNVDWKTVGKVALGATIIVGLGVAAVATGGSTIAVMGLVGASAGGITGSIQSKITGGNVVDGVTSGIVNGALTGTIGEITGNAYIGNAVGGFVGGGLNAAFSGENVAISASTSLVVQTFVGGNLGTVVDQAISDTAKGISNAIGNAVAKSIPEVFGIGAGSSIDVIKNQIKSKHNE